MRKDLLTPEELAELLAKENETPPNQQAGALPEDDAGRPAGNGKALRKELARLAESVIALKARVEFLEKRLADLEAAAEPDAGLEAPPLPQGGRTSSGQAAGTRQAGAETPGQPIAQSRAERHKRKKTWF